MYLYIIEREKRDINLYKATGNLYASTMRQQKVARKKNNTQHSNPFYKEESRDLSSLYMTKNSS